MIITSSHTAVSVSAKVWLNGLCDSVIDDSKRFDAASVQISRQTGRAKAETYTDVGLPILQPQTSKVEIGALVWDEYFDGLSCGRTAEHFARVIASLVLSKITGFRLSDQPVEAQSPSYPIDAAESFPDLVACVELGEFTAKPENHSIGITPQLAEFGQRFGLLKRVDTNLEPTKYLTLSGAENTSALDTARQIALEQQTLGTQLPEGLESLDLDAAARALSSIPSPSAATVYYFANCDSPHHTIRCQAAEAYPLFADLLATDTELSKLIDNKMDLAPAIAKRLGLSKGHVRRLRKLTTPVQSNHAVGNNAILQAIPEYNQRNRGYKLNSNTGLEQICKVLKSFPANWVPETNSSWNDLLGVFSCCALPLNAAFNVSFEDFFLTAKADWPAFKATLKNSCEIRDSRFEIEELSLATSDAIEMVDDYSRSVLLPVILERISAANTNLPVLLQPDLVKARRLAFTILVGRAENIAAVLLSAARKWMHRMPALIEAERIHNQNDDSEDQILGDGMEWPSLCSDFEASNGFVVRNLCSESALQVESHRLSHCVGRLYVNSARDGTCHIFSVRSKDNSESYSTIQLSCPKSGPAALVRADMTVIQHKAEGNGKPAAAAKKACSEWLENIRNGNLPMNLDTVQSWRRRRREAELEGCEEQLTAEQIEFIWQTVLGRNWKNPEVRLAIWNEWQYHILRGQRTRLNEPKDLLQHPGVQDFLAAISPNS